jgi:hypothetical protein
LPSGGLGNRLRWMKLKGRRDSLCLYHRQPGPADEADYSEDIAQAMRCGAEKPG